MGETCSVCGVAVSGADVLYAPNGSVVCPTHFAAIDPSAGVGKAPWRMSAIAGGVVGAIPFGVHMSSSSFSSVNGQITSFVYRDWIAVICGVIAATLGVMTVFAARKEQLQRALAFAAGLGVLALGGVQIARGLGVFARPGGAADSSTSTSLTISQSAAPDPVPAEAAPPERKPATNADEDACEKGSAASCYKAGDFYAHGDRASKAPALYQRGCELGDLDSCSELGYALSEGLGTNRDLAKAKEIFEKACTSGHTFSCVRLGILYYDGNGVKKDPKRALALFEEACDKGDDANSATGCDRAGEQLYAGDGVKADKKRAKAYLAKACKRDEHYCDDAKAAK